MVDIAHVGVPVGLSVAQPADRPTIHLDVGDHRDVAVLDLAAHLLRHAPHRHLLQRPEPLAEGLQVVLAEGLPPKPQDQVVEPGLVDAREIGVVQVRQIDI